MSKKKVRNRFENCDIMKCLPVPQTPEQDNLLKAMKANDVVFATGPAGTGKTHLSVMYGMTEFLLGKYDQMVFTRPCVEANGEKMGFLPGDIAHKIAPYLIPVFDILHTYLGTEIVDELLLSENIRTIPLAFLRGTSFNKAFIVADEAQNMTTAQMRLLLTRIGKNSKCVVTGDLRQSDIGPDNGLTDSIKRFVDIPRLSVVELTEKSIVRSEIVRYIEAAYHVD